MAATRKQCREELARRLRADFSSVVDRIYDHAIRSFTQDTVMMILPGATSRQVEGQLTFQGIIPYYQFVILVAAIRRNDGDEGKLEAINAEMTDFVYDNRTSDYWMSMAQVDSSDVSPETIADKEYWIELTTLEVKAK